MESMTPDELVQAARDACEGAGQPISRADFQRLTGISQHHIYRAFPDGGWTELKRRAGIGRHPKANIALTDDDLLQEWHRVANEIGGLPTWPQFNDRANVSADVVRRRFGGLRGTLMRYRGWLEEHDPDSERMAELQAASRHETPPPPSPGPVTTVDGRMSDWSRGSGPVFGPPMNFRGLRHAPINEQGVVFLFGMVAYELGYIVEAVHAAYPDCEAKRCVDSRRNLWQAVRIEFEFTSSNFREHGHDPANCDAIVCWHHDWPDCPIEVVELRSLLDMLDG